MKKLAMIIGFGIIGWFVLSLVFGFGYGIVLAIIGGEMNETVATILGIVSFVIGAVFGATR